MTYGSSGVNSASPRQASLRPRRTHPCAARNPRTAFDVEASGPGHVQSQVALFEDELVALHRRITLSFVPHRVQNVKVHIARRIHRRLHTKRAVGFEGHSGDHVERRFRRTRRACARGGGCGGGRCGGRGCCRSGGRRCGRSRRHRHGGASAFRFGFGAPDHEVAAGVERRQIAFQDERRLLGGDSRREGRKNNDQPVYQAMFHINLPRFRARYSSRHRPAASEFISPTELIPRITATAGRSRPRRACRAGRRRRSCSSALSR